jgi:hypothetical protein
MLTPSPAAEVGAMLRGMADAATCQAVDSRDTRIEPVPPGIPRKKVGEW